MPRKKIKSWMFCFVTNLSWLEKKLLKIRFKNTKINIY